MCPPCAARTERNQALACRFFLVVFLLSLPLAVALELRAWRYFMLAHEWDILHALMALLTPVALPLGLLCLVRLSRNKELRTVPNQAAPLRPPSGRAD